MRRTCGDLVSDALVAGSSRAHPVLLVELPDAAPVATADGAPDDVDAPDDTDSHMDQNLYSGTDAARALAAEIVRRLAGACAPLFPYERIARAEWVLVLPRGSLVRNKEKGNVRCVVRLLRAPCRHVVLTVRCADLLVGGGQARGDGGAVSRAD